jgi:hypothetical protein
VTRTCIICRKSFQKRPNETWSKFKFRRFCSRQCSGYHEGKFGKRGMPYCRFTPKHVRCAECTNRFYTSRPNQRFCSVLCKDRQRYHRRRSLVLANMHIYYKKNHLAIKHRVKQRQDGPKGIAQLLVRAAVRTGKIKKPKYCEECGHRRPLSAHHPDYRRPLKVRWLCSECHGKEHRIATPSSRV